MDKRRRLGVNIALLGTKNTRGIWFLLVPMKFVYFTVFLSLCAHEALGSIHTSALDSKLDKIGPSRQFSWRNQSNSHYFKARANERNVVNTPLGFIHTSALDIKVDKFGSSGQFFWRKQNFWIIKLSSLF